MKNIIKIFIFIISYFSYNFFANSDFIICDSWNINIFWKNVSEICNWWYENLSIEWIESFTWSYIDFNSWFFWNKYSFIPKMNIYNSIVIWFFDLNQKTVISNVNPNYETIIWFLWQSNILEKNIDLKQNLPIWFFDEIKKTKASSTSPNYILPVWFFWNYKWLIKELKTNTWITNIWSTNIILENNQSKKVVVNNITLKEFYIYIFIKYSKYDYLNYWYKKDNYDIFINNLVDLLLWVWQDTKSNIIISDFEQIRLELYIENSHFKFILPILMKNMMAFNLAYSYTINTKQEIYILNYFLNWKNN